MKNFILGLVIGTLIGSFVKVGMVLWLILGAAIMYVAIKNQFIK